MTSDRGALARGKEAVERLRSRSPFLDHVYRTVRHYNHVNGNGLAGAVTYYAFLSFFPILAIAFFVIGLVSRLYPQARANLTTAIDEILPHVVGPGGEIHLTTIEQAAGTAGFFGLVGLLYSGLGWLTGMRRALEQVFEMSRSQYPTLVVGLLRDIAFLVIVGVILLLSVAMTGVATVSSTRVLDWVGLGHELSWLVHVVVAVVGTGANALLFYTLFRLLARPRTPRGALWQGALLGGIGFEALKLGSTLLLASIRGRPAFEALGIALVLVVWINYFSRVVMVAASWAHTSAPARAARARERRAEEPPTLVVDPSLSLGGRVHPRVAFGAGAATMLGVLALIRRRRR